VNAYLAVVVIVALARPDELARTWAADRRDKRRQVKR
jgi:hypothetical protein